MKIETFSFFKSHLKTTIRVTNFFNSSVIHSICLIKQRLTFLGFKSRTFYNTRHWKEFKNRISRRYRRLHFRRLFSARCKDSEILGGLKWIKLDHLTPLVADPNNETRVLSSEAKLNTSLPLDRLYIFNIETTKVCMSWRNPDHVIWCQIICPFWH